MQRLKGMILLCFPVLQLILLRNKRKFVSGLSGFGKSSVKKLNCEWLGITQPVKRVKIQKWNKTVGTAL